MGSQQVPALMRRQAALLKFCGSLASLIGSWSVVVSDRLQLWRERKRQRRALAGLSDYMLKDMGLTRGGVVMESGKRFWES
jgi:uncharacterized protein YjiS (DUF1127 family)